MCGIYGCLGKNAYNKVIDGLKMILYRGYDSCGIAYFDNGFKVCKTTGSLENLQSLKTNVTIAFGHTRWATNGIVSYENAHPHVSYDKKITIVHNGVITNAEKIKESLLKQNINFYSTTDTEIVANYVAKKCETNDIEKVLKDLYNILEGNFSMIVANNKGDLYLLKRFNPLNILTCDNEIYISSDLSSLQNGKLYSLEDNDIIKLSNNEIISLNGRKLEFIEHKNTYEVRELDGYKHFMEKEIFETPVAIRNTYYEIKDSEIIQIINNYSKITLTGCGTAYHACLIGEYLFRNELEKDVETIIASNYIIKKSIKSDHLHIIVSQSGETADCIKVAEQVKEFGGKLLVITNEKLSILSKISDYQIFTNAEREVAIASTKTYSSQIFVLAYICKKLKDSNYQLEIDKFVKELDTYIKKLNIDEYAHALYNYDKMIMIAKDIDYLTIYEACLKIRETDYIFTLPMYSGELKHGTLALIDKNAVVLALNTSKNKDLLNSTINSIKSREGNVIDISKLVLEGVDDFYKPIFAIIPFQLISYKIALLNNLNPDKPRNLAKSVTVE